jgi:iron complex outermembrane recepter protein
MLSFGMALVSITAFAEGPARPRDLTEATLEDLMNIEVTTASKREQRLSQTPAAVFVITQEDIRRSGMSNIPDLLRMVPGVQVAQAQGGQWAISARGFNDTFSNKLLVLVDGRSVYSPIDSGVFWDEQDVLLENIERIEVIRGPGATMWGANAVNGVINIITKTAQDTPGALATTGVGDGGQSLAGFRYGGQLGRSGHYRVSTKYLHGRSLWDSTDMRDLGGQSALSVGIRAEWALSGRDSLTVQGDIFRSTAETDLVDGKVPFALTDRAVAETSGGSVMANWTRTESETSKTVLQVYFSHPQRSEAIYGDSYSTVDVDFHHERALSESNALMWGVGFRDSSLHTSGTPYASFSPPSRNDALFSSFVQDQWTIVPDRVAFIVGSKFERNGFTGLEIQPSARILWTPDSSHTLWAAASRAVRAPSMLEFNLHAYPGTSEGPGGIPIVPEVLGSTSFRSEDALAYELGYRLQARQRFSVDVAAHYDTYTHLKTYEVGAPSFEFAPQPHLSIQSRFANLMSGETHGFEIASNWSVTDRWRLVPSYSLLRLHMRLDPTSADVASRGYIEGQSPRQQVQFRSNLDISRKLQFDAAAYYTGALPNLAIPAYTRLDARLGYRPREIFEISLSGQNLQGGRHTEFVSAGPYTMAQIGRSFLLKLTWGF